MGVAQPFNVDFYVTAATVIPVLYLPLLLPGGILYKFGVWAKKEGKGYFVLLPVTLALGFSVFGEVSALIALQRRWATTMEATFVEYAVYGLSVLTVVCVVFQIVFSARGLIKDDD